MQRRLATGQSASSASIQNRTATAGDRCAGVVLVGKLEFGWRAGRVGPRHDFR